MADYGLAAIPDLVSTVTNCAAKKDIFQIHKELVTKAPDLPEYILADHDEGAGDPVRLE